MKPTVFFTVLSTGLLWAGAVVCAPSRPARGVLAGMAPSRPARGVLAGMAPSRPARGVLASMAPACAEHHQFCTKKHPEYPQQLINDLLEKFQVSLAPIHDVTDKRDSFESESQNDCEHDFDYSLLYEVRDERGRVRVVAQAHNLTQQFRVERCTRAGRVLRDTAHFQSAHLARHNVSCVQNYTVYNFVILNEDASGFEALPVELPTYCVCRLGELEEEESNDTSYDYIG